MNRKKSFQMGSSDRVSLIRYLPLKRTVHPLRFLRQADGHGLPVADPKPKFSLLKFLGL